MTLLSVAQDVVDVVGFPRPLAIVSSTDVLPRQILGFAKETLEELGTMGWPILEVPYTFNTVVGQAAYDLPSDFDCEVGDSVYMSSQYYAVRGSLTPSDWQRQRNTTATQLGMYKYRIFGLPLKLYITPTPTRIETVTLEYRTTSRVKQADNSYKPTFYDDADVSLVPERLLRLGLKWRMRRAKGMDYSEEFDDYEIARSMALAQALDMGSLPVATRGLGPEPLTDGYVRQNGFGV